MPENDDLISERTQILLVGLNMAVLLLAIGFTIVTGYRAAGGPVGYPGIKLGELPAEVLKEHDKELINFLVGIIATVLFSGLLFVLELHIRLVGFKRTALRTSSSVSGLTPFITTANADLKAILGRIESQIAIQNAAGTKTAVSSLAKVRGTVHRYHFTTEDGESFWTHNTDTFVGRPEGGVMTAKGPILLTAKPEKAEPDYLFEARSDGTDLSIFACQTPDGYDMSVELYPMAHTKGFPLGGVSIHRAGSRLVSSICLLSPEEIGSNTPLGRIHSAETSDLLNSEWRKFAFENIARLPLTMPVASADPSERISVSPWSDVVFERFLATTEDDGDLRVMTTGFSAGVPDTFKRLLKKGVRIRIIIAGPDLMEARHRLRPDRESALEKIGTQLKVVREMQGTGTGKIEVLQSDVMPCGFVAINSAGAIYGFFLARETYALGPMIEIGTKTDLWNILGADWEARWNDAREKLIASRSFHQFWGVDGSIDKSAPSKGVIVLQSDAFADLAVNLRRPGDASAEVLATDRAFKARRWLNACDTEGAQAIMSVFSQQRVSPPKLFLAKRGIPDPDDMCLELIMGGYTDKTVPELRRIGRGWMHFKNRKKSGEYLSSGDTLFLHPSLIPHHGEFTEWLRPDVEDDGLTGLVPADWDANYVERWSDAVRNPKSSDTVKDYAFILRHVEHEQQRTKFILCGFTEVGTKAAGCYLAEHWGKLYTHYVGEENGNFLVLIAGESNPNKLRDSPWKSVLAITPEHLAALDCIWNEHLPSDARPHAN